MFRKDFVWGAATAAYQIEGGVREDGRTQSVWDMLCERAGAVCNGDTGETACDFYHRYREDIAMMKRFGIRAFRMSFSWNRIFPEGTGAVNEKGLDFYDRVVDELLKNGIVPYVTLLHWDLPRALYERGGYMNPDFCNWFADYARVVAGHFSDRVKNFFTFNEPQLILGAHRGSGKAPALSLSDAETVPVAHHILLAHGRAVRAMRAEAGDLALGMANQGCFFYPVSDTPENEAAAKRETFEYRRPNWYSSLPWYADPVFLGKYPEPLLSRLEKYLPAGWEKDMAEIAEPIDFCGQNFYNAFPVDEKGESVPFPPGTAYNSEHWNVSPSGLYYSVKWQYERYRKPATIGSPWTEKCTTRSASIFSAGIFCSWKGLRMRARTYWGISAGRGWIILNGRRAIVPVSGSSMSITKRRRGRPRTVRSGIGTSLRTTGQTFGTSDARAKKKLPVFSNRKKFAGGREAMK